MEAQAAVHPDTLKALRRVPLFATLDDEQLLSVARCVVSSSARKGDEVVVQGVPGEALHVVRSGRATVERLSGGRRTVVAELGEGDAFGEMSLLDTSPTSASVIAQEPTELLSIGRLDLEVLLNWDTVLAAKMWRSFALQLARSLREANERLSDR